MFSSRASPCCSLSSSSKEKRWKADEVQSVTRLHLTAATCLTTCSVVWLLFQSTDCTCYFRPSFKPRALLTSSSAVQHATFPSLRTTPTIIRLERNINTLTSLMVFFAVKGRLVELGRRRTDLRQPALRCGELLFHFQAIRRIYWTCCSLEENS